MNWDLELAAKMLVGFSLASLLVVNLKGFKYTVLYIVFAYLIHYQNDHFFNYVQLFLVILLLLNPTEIRGSLIFALLIMTISAIITMIWATTQAFDLFIVRDLTAVSALITSVIFLIPKHKDYSLSITLALFSIFFYSYANQYSPFARVSWPFACLSLLPYLGMTVIGKHFEGSIAHKLLTKLLKVIAHKIKVGGDSRKTMIVHQIIKLK